MPHQNDDAPAWTWRLRMKRALAWLAWPQGDVRELFDHYDRLLADARATIDALNASVERGAAEIGRLTARIKELTSENEALRARLAPFLRKYDPKTHKIIGRGEGSAP